MKRGRGEYPPDWLMIARRVKDEARWHCIRCGTSHAHPGRVLTVHHWNGDKADCRWWNLMALCQGCHLSIQGRVNPDQVFAAEHTEWCKPYAAGLYAEKYLGEELTRFEVMNRLEELLALERKM